MMMRPRPIAVDVGTSRGLKAVTGCVCGASIVVKEAISNRLKAERRLEGRRRARSEDKH